jgi:hypothetical protein
MPNWCENKLTIKGPHDRMMAFITKARGEYQHYAMHKYDLQWEEQRKEAEGDKYRTPEQRRKEELLDFSFHALYPIPDEIMAKQYDPHGYAQEHKQWGVKWGGSDTRLVSYKNGIAEYTFTTPWGPPTAFLEKVASDWKDLSFALSFIEEYPSRGRLLLKDGKLVEEINEMAGKGAFAGGASLYYRSH